MQRIHLKAPANWINDPNGFIYYKGQYHLFYQHFPYAPRWGTMHWGHAVSDDLAHWEHKKIALFPTRYEDMNGCFSGCAIEHNGRLILFYTGIRYHEMNPEDIHSSIGLDFDSAQLTISSEDGMYFDNFGGKRIVVPPIEDRSIGDRCHTRDPKVWRGNDAWYMVLGTTDADNFGKLLFYKSTDLTNWSLTGSTSSDGSCGWMWECPDYFEVDGQGVLIFSPMGYLKDGKLGENQAVCALAQFSEETGTLEFQSELNYFDYGLDPYAVQSTLDEEGRRVAIAWLRMPKPVEGEDGPWTGMFCIPRVVEVRDGHICFRTHPAVEKQFTKTIASPKEADSAGYRIEVSLSEGDELNVGGYRIFRQGNRIHTDRSAVFERIENYRVAFESPEVGENCDLTIFVDDNLIEVFINDGEYVISNAVYGLKQELYLGEGIKAELTTLES